MSRPMLVMVCVAGWSLALGAQQPVPSYTQMILGVGTTFSARAYALGFEHKPADSPIAWRVLLERWSRQSGPEWTEQQFTQQLFGAQLLGLRLFRQQRRLQPYILGGLGLYREQASSATRVLTPGNGAMWQYSNTERLIPSIIWGTGLNLRLRGIVLFGEVKLPVPSQGIGLSGPQAPLMFGIRF